MKSNCPSCGSPEEESATTCAVCGEPVPKGSESEVELTPPMAPATTADVGAEPGRRVFPYYVVALALLAVTWVIFEVSNPPEVKGPPQGNSAQSGMPPGHPPTAGAQPQLTDAQQAEMDRMKKEITAKATAVEKALSADPGNDSLQLVLANYYYDLGRFDEAVPLYKAHLARHPDDPNARTDMAYCMANLMDIDGAIAELRKAMALDAKHQNAPYLMAMMFMYKQERDSSIHWMKHVLSIDSTTQQGKNAALFLKEMAAAHVENGGPDRQ